MDEVTYPVRVRFSGEEPDIAKIIRRTESFLYWIELHELYARTRMRASSTFRELVLDDIQADITRDLQGLLETVVRIEDHALIKVFVDEDRGARFTSLGWEVSVDAPGVSAGFEEDEGTYIEALSLDGSMVYLKRWCYVEMEIDGEPKRLTAEIGVLVDLNATDSLFHQPRWFHIDYTGQLEFKRTFFEDSDHEGDKLDAIGRSLMNAPA